MRHSLERALAWARVSLGFGFHSSSLGLVEVLVFFLCCCRSCYRHYYSCYRYLLTTLVGLGGRNLLLVVIVLLAVVVLVGLLLVVVGRVQSKPNLEVVPGLGLGLAAALLLPSVCC